jgi:hypothetical protein
MALSNHVQCVGYVVAVLGMGSATGKNHQTYAAGYDSPGIGSANTSAGRAFIRFNAAGSHHTKTAANTFVTKLALGLLGYNPVKCSYNAFFLCYFDHF